MGLHVWAAAQGCRRPNQTSVSRVHEGCVLLWRAGIADRKVPAPVCEQVTHRCSSCHRHFLDKASISSPKCFLRNGKHNLINKVNERKARLLFFFYHKYPSVSFLGGIQLPVQMTPDRGTETHFLVEMDDLESHFHIYHTSLHVLCGDERIARQL